MEYQVSGEVTSVDDVEMLAVLEWLKDNYGTEINNAQAIGKTKQVIFNLTMSSFADAVTTITALKTQFGVRLVEYNLTVN